MKAAIEINAEARKTTGKGAARAARRKGFVPVSVYANGKPNQSLNVEARVLANEYFRGGFMNKIVSLKLDGRDVFTIPRDIQLNPVTDKIEHADFIAVDEKSVVKVRVPVRFLNTDKAVGLKRGGVLNIVRHEVELYAPVASIPTALEVDVAELNIGDSVHLHNMALPEGVSPVIKGRDFTIASIAGRQKEEEEAPVAAAAVATGAAAPTAGAVPASTAKAPAAGAAAPAAGAKPAGKK
ncbi:MAG: 50S ribosomal protein L25/general stress protein Ctc [Rickettsiales bacterium]